VHDKVSQLQAHHVFMRRAEDERIHSTLEVHVIQVIRKNVAIDIHISLRLTIGALEHAVKDRSHGEHATHDGTCSVRTLEQSKSRGKKIRTYEVKKCANNWRILRWATRIGEIS
jgi:hypothetical protein